MAFVQLSRSFNLPSTLIIRCHVSTRTTKEASCFWGCGQIFTLIIKRILGIKHIFPCNFGNKRMRLLTHVYGIRGEYANLIDISQVINWGGADSIVVHRKSGAKPGTKPSKKAVSLCISTGVRISYAHPWMIWPQNRPGRL